MIASQSMAKVSKGKFRHLRDLYGYNDFVMYEDLTTGYCTGYHRGKVYRAVDPVSAEWVGIRQYQCKRNS